MIKRNHKKNEDNFDQFSNTICRFFKRISFTYVYYESQVNELIYYVIAEKSYTCIGWYIIAQ